MGTRSTPEFSALNYGYLSPKLRGRADMDFYDQALDFVLNYVVTPQGELQFRGGSIYVANTRDNKVARLIPFIYGTEDAYVIEATDSFMRFYRGHGLITKTAQAVTNITQTNPAVVSYGGSDTFANGERVYLSSVGGMHQVNGREFIVANVNTGANTFEITDINGVDIDATAYSAYTSGGTVAEIYEISTSFDETEIFEIDYTQAENTLYIVHEDFHPLKLTRASHTSWTLASFDYISSPFGTTLSPTLYSISAITKANPAKVTTTAAHGYSNGDTVKLTDVYGMTEVNGLNFTVRNVTATTFELEDYDSTSNTAYDSGGFTDKYTAFAYPSCVTQFEGRIIYAASSVYPVRMWMSKIREDGVLDDFTKGTNDADSVQYDVRGDQVNRIRWIAAAENYLAVGTSGGEFRVTGSSTNDGITPTSINVKPVSFNGVSSKRPIRLDNYILFTQRNGKTVRSFEYDALADGYTTHDRTLLADHIGSSKFRDFSYTAGTPNLIWGVRNDGRMVGLTFDPSQKVVAWHLHKTDGNYENVTTVPIIDDGDELWMTSEREINGETARFVEYKTQDVELPVFEVFFTGEDNEASDTAAYLTELWKTQKTLVHSDAALIYDGRTATAGIDLIITGADLTAGATVTVEASGAFFTQAMADDLRRVQTPDGGQIQINGYTSATEATGLVLYDLEGTSFTGGEWYYMARTVGGLWHMEGKEVAILADGGNYAGQTVTNGSVLLDDDAGYVIVGLKYIGIGKTEDVTVGDQVGRGQTKSKNATELGVRVRGTVGTKFGTSLYKMEEYNWRENGEYAGRAPYLKDGVIRVPMRDGWANEKYIYWLHDTPTPSNIQYIQPMMETNER